MTVVRSSRVSDRSFIFGFVFFVIAVFFWFVSRSRLPFSGVVTLTLRIDGKIAWKWWVVMLPAFVVDAAILILDVISIPVFIRRHKNNSDLPPEEQVLLFPSIMSSINSILWIAAQVTLVLRLDHIWNTTFTVALIPYFIYSLQNIYMPLYMLCRKSFAFAEEVNYMMSLIIAITIFLCCLKVDGIISWSWGMTFIACWIYYGVQAVIDLFMMCISRGARVQFHTIIEN